MCKISIIYICACIYNMYFNCELSLQPMGSPPN